MPKYETNQRVVRFIRRLPAEFGGFSSQMVPMSGETVQMLHGQMQFQGARIYLAVFTRPGAKHDTIVFSMPLFHVPQGSSDALFEQLLDWNNGATETVHFAVDELLNTVNLVCVRPVEGMAFQEFHYCVSNLIAVKANATSRLQSRYELMLIGEVRA
ncbi:MAG TPA: hypothetical protein VLR94_04785 [Acidobacteriota bacterium]|nr:hypothetical protein [Acidobacteriota bacterium]